MCKVPGRSGSIFAEDSAFVAAKCAVDVPDRISVVEMRSSFTTVRRPAAETGETAEDVRLELEVSTSAVAS